jgi:signal transduction histidine kinase
LSAVSHELRTPLTSIRSFSELLLAYPDTDPAQRREFLGIILHEGERLTRLIKTHAGRGFSDLLNRARIDRAKELLDHGRSALEVSIEVGFADPSYFTKVFRRLTGMTPSTYRARSG